MPEVDSVHRSSSVAQPVLAVYAFVGGLLSFVAYAADLPRLADWLNSGIAIQPNTAIAVIAAAFAVLLMWGGYVRAAGILGVLVAAIGGTVIFEYVSGIDLGIDGLFLFGRTWGRGGTIVPGRMGPPGALSWTMLGLSIVMASIRSRQWPRAVAPSLALVAMAIASLSLIGYLYGASDLYTLPRVTVIALQTSTFVLAISIGVVLGIPDHAPMRLLADQTAAGALMRRILPAVIVVPIVLGLLRLVGEREGYYDLTFGTAIRTLTEIVLLSGLLWWAADTIGRQDRARQLAEDQLVESLRDADRRKNKFLAMLAHELRNPLAPVRNAVALMKSRSQRDPVIDRVSEVIDRQVGLMARLMDDLLDIGRITNDRMELRLERVNLVRIVRDAIEISQPLIQRSGHEVSVMAPQPSIVVEADPARLGSGLQQSGQQRLPVHGEQRPDLDHHRARGNQRRSHRHRYRDRHSARAAVEHLRDVLAGRSDHSSGWRPGHRAASRQTAGRHARRPGVGAERRTRHGQPVHRASARPPGVGHGGRGGHAHVCADEGSACVSTCAGGR